MLHVGLIGLGPTWEHRYRPVLSKLRDRIQIAGIYDSVSLRAIQAAADMRTVATDGLLDLISRPTVRALVILDPAWHGHIPLHWACQFRKPVYLAGSLGASLARINTLQQRVDETGIDLMPELSRRYTPASIRLRELLATRLGRPRRMRIELRLPTQPTPSLVPGQATELDALVGLVDWCRCLVGTSPASVSARYTPAVPGDTLRSAAVRELNVTFTRSARDGEPARAEIRLFLQPSQAGADPPGCLTGHVDCAAGHATLNGADQLSWKIASDAAAETLAADQTDVELMLDHFSRRAVGGLIPVPRIDDVTHALRLVVEHCPELARNTI